MKNFASCQLIWGWLFPMVTSFYSHNFNHFTHAKWSNPIRVAMIKRRKTGVNDSNVHIKNVSEAKNAILESVCSKIIRKHLNMRPV